MIKYIKYLLVFLLATGFVACSEDEGAQILGSLYEKVDITPEPGMNLVGRVTDGTGPIEGVVVSDGVTVTTTDAQGIYQMRVKRNAPFVFVSVPAEYEIPVENGMPKIYKKIAMGDNDVVQRSFKLERTGKKERFTLLALADVQIGRDDEVTMLDNEVLPFLIPYVQQELEVPVYGISLGDLVWDNMPFHEVYKQRIRKIGVPIFQVIGNHDHDQTTLLKDSLGTMHYEMHLGPTCYSANIGRVHYIFIDDILYDRKDAKESYRHGLYDETVHWLIEDLKYVPKDKIIMICAHAQMFNKKTTMVRRNKNFAAYSKALLDFKYVYSWAGHNHHTYLYTSEPERNYDIDNLTSITVTKSTGALRLNRLLNNDGTPQGYFVVDVDGEEVSWYYLCCGKDRNYQMKVYPPARTGGEYVMANIWAHDNKWGAVEWWENGVKVGQMEAHDALDPDYVDLYATVTNKPPRKYCKPVNSFHMFRIKPSEGIREGEVRVTDRFGNLYTQKVSW